MHGNEGNANQELVSGQALQRTSRSQAGQLKVLLRQRSGGAQKPAREAKNKEGTLNKLKALCESQKEYQNEAPAARSISNDRQG